MFKDWVYDSEISVEMKCKIEKYPSLANNGINVTFNCTDSGSCCSWVYTKTRSAGRLSRPAANSFAYAKMRPAMFYPKMRPAENAAFYPEFPMN